MFLSANDYASLGERLPHEIRRWRRPIHGYGYRLAGAGDKSVRLESIPGWFSKHLKLERFPATPADCPPFYFESGADFQSVCRFSKWAHSWRGIWSDGRALPKDPDPRRMGYSVGHWEGNIL